MCLALSFDVYVRKNQNKNTESLLKTALMFILDCLAMDGMLVRMFSTIRNIL